MSGISFSFAGFCSEWKFGAFIAKEQVYFLQCPSLFSLLYTSTLLSTLVIKGTELVNNREYSSIIEEFSFLDYHGGKRWFSNRIVPITWYFWSDCNEKIDQINFPAYITIIPKNTSTAKSIPNIGFCEHYRHSSFNNTWNIVDSNFLPNVQFSINVFLEILHLLLFLLLRTFTILKTFIEIKKLDISKQSVRNDLLLTCQKTLFAHIINQVYWWITSNQKFHWRADIGVVTVFN